MLAREEVFALLANVAAIREPCVRIERFVDPTVGTWRNHPQAGGALMLRFCDDWFPSQTGHP